MGGARQEAGPTLVEAASVSPGGRRWGREESVAERADRGQTVSGDVIQRRVQSDSVTAGPAE